MVATDVASRGIGMNRKQTPSFLPPCCISYPAAFTIAVVWYLVRALFPLVTLSSCVTCPGFCVLLGPSFRHPGDLCSLPALGLLTLTSASSDTSRLWDIDLDQIKLQIQDLFTPRTVDHCQFSGHGHWPLHG